jgi:hypothetical protein
MTNCALESVLVITVRVCISAYWETHVTSLLADSQLTTAYTSQYSNYAAQTVLCVVNFMADVLAYVIAIGLLLLLPLSACHSGTRYW